MIKRTVVVSKASYLKLKDNQLIIEQDSQMVGKIAIEDLAVLVLEHYAIVITQALIIACQKNNVAIIFCDEKHLPYSLISPLAEANELHHKILLEQIAAKESNKNRIWKQIIKLKITQQAKTLETFNKPNQRLILLASKVKSGDKTNCEAIAARHYWKILFDNDFVRDYKQDGINALLNYGYSIVRAALARSICGAGLHPSLGVFHKNQYNPLALADDLIEPFRPWVDMRVYKLALKNQMNLTQDVKLCLLEILAQQVTYQGKKMPLMTSLSYLLADFKRMLGSNLKQINSFEYPKLLNEVRDK